jgi:RNA polymerase-binding transcription factor DksA
MNMGGPPLDLTKVRASLVQRRAELRTRQVKVERDRRHSEEPLVADFPEQALQTQNDAVLEGIDEAALAEIAEINAALARIEDGRYGICRSCGEPIAAQRLLAMPQAVTCVECGEEAPARR